MNPWTVIAITVGVLAGYALIVQIIGHLTAQTRKVEAELLASIVDHPTRNAARITQTDYVRFIVDELAQHGHDVAIIDLLDCLASSRLALKDDIDGAAVDAYYSAVLGDAS
jgi:hypothetical protein